MILLDNISVPQEAASLFNNWEFWALAVGTISGLVTSYFKQTITINKLTIELANVDEKYDARINSLKEQITSDRLSVRENHNKLYDLCTEMNQRLSTIEGALNKDK